MHKSLHSLAEIRSGYSFRTGIEDDPGGSIGVLQIKDIKGGAEIRPETLPRTIWSTPGKPPLLKPGDIVLPARGDHYDAVVVHTDAPVLASSQLFVVRPRYQELMPDYLCWYLNRPESRNFILRNRAGTSIPMLSMSSLGELPIAVPALQTQQRIVALHHLWQREQALTQTLLVNRKKTLDGVFAKLLES